MGMFACRSKARKVLHLVKDDPRHLSEDLRAPTQKNDLCQIVNSHLHVLVTSMHQKCFAKKVSV